MKSFVLSMAALALTTSVVLAGPNKGSGGSHGSSSGGYHLTHGKEFSGGYFYSGRDHHHWTYWGYSQRYHCNCYWCPDTRCYYYWCPSASCYYPVSYYESAPPAPTPAPVQFQTQTQTQSQTQTQVIRPSGIPAIP